MMKSKWKVGDWSPGNLCVIKWTALPEPPFFAAEYRKVAYVYNQADVPIIAAAPKMYALLDKCESALRHWLSGSIDEPMIGETENTINEIQELLTEARGEK